MQTLRIGTGAGFADDRIESAAELAEHGALGYRSSRTWPSGPSPWPSWTGCGDPRGAYNEWLCVTGRDRPRAPSNLNASVGYLDGYLGTGEISYAGPNAVARGWLTLDVVRERLALVGASAQDTVPMVISTALARP